MQVARIENGVIGQIGTLVELFPNVSFPSIGVEQEFLIEHSLMEVIVWEMFDSTLYKLVTVEPYIRNDKVYTCRIDPKTQEELDYEVTVATQAKENEVRTQRNQLLKDSDWTQVADAPVDKEAWATYRQALRDITSQEGFPLNVVFPNPPL
jgi:hypothetical protein